MRRLVGWVSGAVGGITAYRLLRRQRMEPEWAPVAERDERAEELRAKLAESRVAEPAAEPVVDEPAPDSAVEVPPAEPAEAVAEDSEPPDERRRRVHEEGRAAIDEMQSE
jgi:hypothetical protein